MEDDWRAGYHDAIHTLRHPEALARPTDLEGVSGFHVAAKYERLALRATIRRKKKGAAGP